MHVDLWVAALRIFAAILAIAVFRPAWLQPWRWMALKRMRRTPMYGRPDKALL